MQLRMSGFYDTSFNETQVTGHWNGGKNGTRLEKLILKTLRHFSQDVRFTLTQLGKNFVDSSLNLTSLYLTHFSARFFLKIKLLEQNIDQCCK